MTSTVESLLVLQERDLRVQGLETEVVDLPRERIAIEKELALRTERFGELKEKTRLIEAERKKLDLEVQSKQGAIARYKAQQLSTRKNEEFAALNHEIDHAQKEISELEDKELELMEAYEKGLATVAEGQKELAQHQDKAKNKTAELEKRIAAVTAELGTAREQQATAEKAVPEEALARYRRILKSKKDVAIVPIEHGSCTGCHMKLTSQTILSARGSEDLTACENCGRLLYWLE
jgi:predicted  nucleic acid-binding Zn-ribbon protein